jgi:hypothetical protein
LPIGHQLEKALSLLLQDVKVENPKGKYDHGITKTKLYLDDVDALKKNQRLSEIIIMELKKMDK